jgi:hypothetical protein
MCDDKRSIEIEIHIAATQFGAPVADQYIINNDPCVLRDERVIDEHSVSGTNAPGVDAWCEGESNSLPCSRDRMFVHSWMPFFLEG